MNRRTFIRGAGTVFVAPLAAEAQPAKLSTIGFLGASTRSAWAHRVARFEQRLHELGWVERRNIAIEYRWADGSTERLAGLAAEFVRLKVDVIVTAGHVAIIAAKSATSEIPIVFAVAGDPVANAIVASLARPGGNITGLSVQQPELAGKRLELLQRVVPSFRRLAMLANVRNPLHLVERDEVRTVARVLGVEVIDVEIRQPEDIAAALHGLRGRADALYVPPDPIIISTLARINTLALGARLPTVHGSREYVEAGGLMSYGPDFLYFFQRAADYVDKILRGVKPADLPVEQPTKFELVINLKTAKALALTIPPSILARADSLLE
jgi:putative ABC transport system substrate-binding protein